MLCPGNMKLIALLAVLGGLPLVQAAPTPAAAAGGFEGRFQLRLQDATPQGASYAVRGDKLRIDVPDGDGEREVHAVIDFSRSRVMVSSAPGGSWSPKPFGPEAAAPDGVVVEETGHMRMVVGQPCEDWRMTEGTSTVEACVVKGVPWFDPRQITGGHVPEWSRTLQARRAFPVSVWVGDPQTRFAMWATDMNHGRVTDDAFAVTRTARGR